MDTCTLADRIENNATEGYYSAIFDSEENKIANHAQFFLDDQDHVLHSLVNANKFDPEILVPIIVNGKSKTGCYIGIWN